jgi:signal recognition particle subunit SRP54
MMERVMKQMGSGKMPSLPGLGGGMPGMPGLPGGAPGGTRHPGSKKKPKPRRKTKRR